mgnify:CR=1 FL=1
MWPRFQVRVEPLPCRNLPWLGVSIPSDSCVGIPVSGWPCMWCCLCVYPSWGFQWWWLQGIYWRHVWPWRVYWVSKNLRYFGNEEWFWWQCTLWDWSSFAMFPPTFLVLWGLPGDEVYHGPSGSPWRLHCHQQIALMKMTKWHLVGRWLRLKTTAAE